jgi:uncharacterized membrane protein/protein-disulfide isomerase
MSMVGLQTTIPRDSVAAFSKVAFVWWTMFACSATALISSSYLAWASLTSSAVAGCGGGSVFDCSHVLHSKWSTVLSIPVSIPAIATHLLVLSMLLSKFDSKRWEDFRWSAIGFASLSAAAAALWFIGVQVFMLNHLCQYCMVAHACGIILAVMYLRSRPAQGVSLKWIAAAASMSVGGLILLQTTSAAPPTHELINYPQSQGGSDVSTEEEALLFEPPQSADSPQTFWTPETLRNQLVREASRLAMMLSPEMVLSCELTADDDKLTVRDDKPIVRSALILNSIKLETGFWPLLGKPDAELVFVELFDYTCEHCQRTHKAIEGARQKLGDRLAIITLPVPLDAACNPSIKTTDANHLESCLMAKLAIAVWSIDHDKFAEFHNHLFEKKPNYAAALIKAKELVDGEKLTATLASKLPGEYVAKHIALYQRAGSGTIPKLMFPKTTSVGAIDSADLIVNLIEQHLR